MAKQTLYTVSSTDDFIRSMSARNWTCIQLNEGVLGVGDWVLIAPTEHQWNFVIREKYLNAWSSAQTIRKCRKLSKAIMKEIEKAEENY